MATTRQLNTLTRLLSIGSGLLLVLGLSACGGTSGQEPIVDDYAIAYVKRPVPVEDPDDDPLVLAEPDVREPTEFNEGGDLYVRDRASPTASETNVTFCITGGLGDVKDVESSYDGSKIIFSLREEDPDPNDDEEPVWDIYEYNVATGGCPVRVISSDIAAERGDDLAPHYLPDGRIVFSSSRQTDTKTILLDEGKPQFSPEVENRNDHALVLHVMNSAGGDIKQISFNQSHDLDPSVMANGEILFTRWDNMGGRNAMNLYTVRPDGTELRALYGVHDHALGTNNSTIQFLSPREMGDGRVMAMIKPFTNSAGGGAPVLIDVANYAENTVPTWPNAGLLTGPAQESAIDLDVRTDGSISPAGRFRSVYPLGDGTNRALVSWSQCRLVDTDDTIIPCPATIPTDAVEAFPLYGIYIYDISQDTQLPVVVPVEGTMIEEPVVAAPRPLPAILFDKAAGIELEQDLADENVGLLHIRSVYDFDGGFSNLGLTGTNALATMANPSLTDADQRPARYLRLVKAASIPDDDVHDFDNTAYGVSNQQTMREIIGYTTIEPDGSVMVKVPANVPLAFSVVDKEGRRITARHQNWFQIKPGEVVECNGCHNHNASPSVPHGYRDDPDSLNTGAATSGVAFPGATATILAEIGETMAEAKVRTACGTVNGINYPACVEITPSVNPGFTDLWGDGAIADVTDLRYADLTSPALPASAACQTTWEAGCRTMIHYETHIHPLWSIARTNMAAEDRTCTACHTNDAVVPAAQLDLTDGPSDLEADHYKSYRELFSADNEVDAAGNTVTEDVEIQATDGEGNPLFETDPDTGDLILDGDGQPIPIMVTIQVPVPVAAGPSMSVNGARSSRFINVFLPGGSHEGDLTPAEIRLISEWLDIGAQYYNNPFAAPAT